MHERNLKFEVLPSSMSSSTREFFQIIHHVKFQNNTQRKKQLDDQFQQNLEFRLCIISG